MIFLSNARKFCSTYLVQAHDSGLYYITIRRMRRFYSLNYILDKIFIKGRLQAKDFLYINPEENCWAKKG